MKKRTRDRHVRSVFLQKILLVVFLMFSFSLSYATTEDSTKLVNFTVKSESLNSALIKFKDLTGVQILFNEELLGDKACKDLNLKNVSVDVALGKILEGSGFVYSKVDGVYMVKRASEQKDAQAKPRVFTGEVVDVNGEPLPGVTVVVKGTTFGGATDVDGKFELSFTLEGEVTLVFSFVGMESQEIVVKDEKPLRVVLKESSESLEEVVVTGVFERRAESFTGSATTVTRKELLKRGNQNLIQSLRNMDPALNISQNLSFGSDPNKLPDMDLRGTSSFPDIKGQYTSNPNLPLFILDGFESTLKAISNLSMDRVASITVLKDAAATAIYGSKAANGVIVVETKAPEAGKLQVNYNGNLNFSFADLSDYNLMNAREKLAFEKLAGRYGPLDANGEIIDEGYQSTYYQRLAEVEKGVDSYWLNEPLRFATSHSHDLFIEGGDSRMRYGLGVNYNRTAGVMKGSDNNVLNGNVRLIYRYKNLAFTDYVNFDYSVSDREKVAFSKFSQANPYYRKVNDYGEPEAVLEKYKLMSGDEYVFNPLYDMSLNSSNRTRNFGFRNNFEVDWRVIEPLRLRARISVSKSVSKQEVFQSPKASVFYGKSEKEKGSYSETNGDVLSYDGDLNATFGKLFDNKHMVNAVVGMQVSDNKNKISGFRAIGYVDDRNITPTFSNGYPSGEKPSYSNSQKRSASYYMNGGYAYDNRYLLDANFRADGSSVFGVSNKFTTTWAVGVGWNIHNESFVKNCAFIDFLKLRYSIGNPGNQNFSLYMSSNMYSYTTSFNNPFGLGARISSYGNPNLEWQKTIDQNFGFDVEIFHRRLRLNFDYFMKNTDPLLVSVTLPTSTGTASVPTNLGKQTTKGYTLSANVVVLQKEELNWSINGNLRHLKYEYKNIGNALEKYNAQNRKDETDQKIGSSNLKRYYDGGSPSDIWAVRSAGIDPVTGREIFIKKDGTQTFEFDYNDEVIVGNSDPKLEGVIGSSFYWKGLSASINFRYRVGGQIFLSALYNKVENISDQDVYYNQDKRALYDRWQKPGDVAKFKAISLNETTPMSSRFVADENTLSCESVSIGYETQARWLRHFGASSMTIRGYMNDIFRISTVKNERGLDYPFARSVAFSLGIRF